MAKKRLVKNSQGQYGILDEHTNQVFVLDQSTKLKSDKGKFYAEKDGSTYNVDAVDDNINDEDINILKKKDVTDSSGETDSTDSGLSDIGEKPKPAKQAAEAGRRFIIQPMLPGGGIDYSGLAKFGPVGEFLADVIDIPTNIINAGVRTIFTSTANDAVRALGDSKSARKGAKLSDYQDIADNNLTANSIEKSSYYKKMENKTGDWFDTAAAIPEILVESALGVTGAWKSALAGAATGAATGAAVGTIAAPVTAIGGAIGGAQAGASYANEVGGAIFQKMQEQGIDITDAKQLQAAVNDEKFITEAAEYGRKRGVPIAAIDLITAGMAGFGEKAAIKVARSLAKKAGGEIVEDGVTIAAKGLSDLGEARAKSFGAMTTEVVGGSFGEAVGQLASEGKITDVDAILLEGIAELGAGAPTGVYSYVKANQINRQLNKRSDETMLSLQEALATMDETDPGRPALEERIKALQAEKENRNNLTATQLEAAPVSAAKRILELTERIDGLNSSLEAMKATPDNTLSEDQQREKRRVFVEQLDELNAEREELLAEAEKAKAAFAETVGAPTAPLEVQRTGEAFNLFDDDSEIEPNEAFTVDTAKPLTVTRSETKGVAVEEGGAEGTKKRAQASVLNIEQEGKKLATALEVTGEDGSTKYYVPELQTKFNTVDEATAAVKEKLSGKIMTESERSGINRVLVRKGLLRTPIVFTQNGAQMEISNEVKTKILKAQQALRSVSDANVYLYSSDDDYVAGVRSESNADGFDEQGARNSNASYVRDGNIHINITKMNQQSLSHEIFHAALVGIAKKNPDAFIAMRKQIMGRIRPDATLNVVNKKTGERFEMSGAEYLQQFSERYSDEKGFSEDIRAEEYLSELAGLLANNENLLSDKTFVENIRLAIRKLLKTLNIDTAAFDELSDATELVDFMKSFNESLKTGGRINLDKIKGKYETRTKTVPAQQGGEAVATTAGEAGVQETEEGQPTREAVQEAVKRKRGNKTPTGKREIKDPVLKRALEVDSSNLLDIVKQYFVKGGTIVRGRTKDISKRTVTPEAGSLVTLFTKKGMAGYKDDTKAMRARFKLTDSRENGALTIPEIAKAISDSEVGKKYKLFTANIESALESVLKEFADKKQMAQSVLDNNGITLEQEGQTEIGFTTEQETQTQEQFEEFVAGEAGMTVEEFQEAVGEDPTATQMQAAAEEAIDIVENPEENPGISEEMELTAEEEALIEGMTEQESEEYLGGIEVEPAPVKAKKKSKTAAIGKGAKAEPVKRGQPVPYDVDEESITYSNQTVGQLLPQIDLAQFINDKKITLKQAALIKFILQKAPSSLAVRSSFNDALKIRGVIKGILYESGDKADVDKILESNFKYYAEDFKLFEKAVNKIGASDGLNMKSKYGIYKSNSGSIYITGTNGNIDWNIRDNGTYKTEDEAIDKLIELMTFKKPSKGKSGLVAFKIKGSKYYRLGKIINGEFFSLNKGPNFVVSRLFNTKIEAELYLSNNEDAVIKEFNEDFRTQALIKEHIESSKSNRVGVDWRNGKDISSEELYDTFELKGVDFIAGMSKEDKQRMLNEAYDAMNDMAAILNIPLKAVGLGKKISIKFGIGKVETNKGGNFMPIAYDIKLGRANIGSLAHEWWHALDNHFGALGFYPGTMITEKDRYATRKDDLRIEMFAAFKDIADDIEGSNYEKRAKKLDLNVSPNYRYKQRMIELTARAFESYITSKAESSGNRNDFLVKKWDTAKSGTDIYEYLETQEMPGIEPLFDNLFKTIKAREESDRTVLYQLSGLEVDPEANGPILNYQVEGSDVGLVNDAARYKMVELYGDPQQMLSHFRSKFDIKDAAAQKGFTQKLRSASRTIEGAISDNIMTRSIARVFNTGMNAIEWVGDAGFVNVTEVDSDGNPTTKKVSFNYLWQKAFGMPFEKGRQLTLKGLESNNRFANIASNVAVGLVKNLSVTDKLQKQTRDYQGYKDNAHNEIFRLSKSLNGMIGFDAQALRRVHSLLDPEAFEEVADTSLPNNPLELSVSELRLYNALRTMNDYIHEWHMMNGFLDKDTYEKNKGKYFARAYEDIEKKKFKDINDVINSFGVGADLSMFKQRKDFEMVELNLLEDPIYITSKRLAQMVHNQAIIDFANSIVDSNEYAIYDKLESIPENIQKYYRKLDGFGNSIRYGELTNKYVPMAIYEQIYGTQFTDEVLAFFFNAFKHYDKLGLRQALKKSKTVYNPLARLGNIISSFAFAFQGGVDPFTLLTKRIAAKEQIDKYGEYVQDLTKAGVIGTSGINQILQGLEEGGATYRALVALKVPESAIAKANEYDKVVRDTYGKADDVAKVAMYMALVEERGKTKAEAIQIVAESMQNYSTVSKFFVLGSMTPVIGNAFIRFKADATRILYNGMAKRPLFTMSYIAMLYGIKELLSDLSGEDDEEKEAREERPFTTKWGVGPFALPMNWKIGDKEYNVARYLSPYYIYDQGYYGDNLVDISQYLPYQVQKLQPGKGSGAFNQGYVAALSDPFAGVFAQWLFDYDYRGNSIADPGASRYVPQRVSDAQQFRNQLSYLGRSLGSPYYGWIADQNAAWEGKLDMYDRKRDPLAAALNLVIKNEDIDSKILTDKYANHLNRMFKQHQDALTIIKAAKKRLDDDVLRIQSSTELTQKQKDNQIKDLYDAAEELRMEKHNEMMRIKEEAIKPLEMFNKLKKPKM